MSQQEKKVIAIVNQKGGVGKTTTVVNLAAALAKRGNKILVVDIDPQGNATTGLGLEKNQVSYSVYDLLVNKVEIKDCIVKTDHVKLDVIPANRHLSGAEVELIEMKRRELRLKEALAKVSHKYDLVLVDCPPSLSMLTLNALAAADLLLVPVQCEYYALEGLTDLLTTIERLKGQINPSIELLGLVRTMYDGRNNLATEVSKQLQQYFGDKVFKTFIPRNVRLAEAPSHGMTSVSMDVNAAGSQAYLSLASEIVDCVTHLN